MLSVVAGALLMTAAALTGLAIKKSFRTRMSVFTDACDFCAYYKREISSLKTPLDEILRAYCKEGKGVFSGIMKKYYAGMSVGFSNAEEVLSDVRSNALRDEDNLIIASFLFALGKSDLENEITNIKRYQDVFEEKKRKYESDLNKKGDMYYKLFVLLGITLMILVV